MTRKTQEEVRDWAYFMRLREAQYPVLKPVASKEETAVIVLSDWHYGKLIEKGEGGPESENEYNPQICVQRVNALRRSFEKIAEGQTQIDRHSKIDEVLLILAGDLVDGEGVYATQSHHLSIPAGPQVPDVSTLLTDFCLTVSKGLKVPMRIECIPGNHGFFAQKSSGASEKTNFDTLVHYMLAANLKASKIKYGIVVHEFPSAIIEAKGMRGLVRHKAPSQTVLAGACKKWGGWHAKSPFDFVITGHWHNASRGNWMGKPIFYNGSLAGDDALTDELAVSSSPSQWMFGIQWNRIPTFCWELETENGR